MASTGVLSAIREILGAAELHDAREIMQSLRERGIKFSPNGVQGMLSNCSNVGEFLVHKGYEQMRYSLNPEFDPTKHLRSSRGERKIPAPKAVLGRIQDSSASWGKTIVLKRDLQRVVLLAHRHATTEIDK